MTNREYMESLSDKDLAKYIWEEQPWQDYCYSIAEPYDELSDAIWTNACIIGLRMWLNQEKE